MKFIQELFDKQQNSLQTLKNSTYKDRIQKIDRIHHFLTQEVNKQSLYQALRQDLGKSEMEAKVTELFPVISNIKHIKSHLKSWMKPQRKSTPLALTGTKSYVRYEPKGSTLIIAPWNYPFSLAIDPLLYAIASGCAAIVKPSEFSSATSAFIHSMIGELFPEAEFAVVEGAIPESQFLLSLPFHHIFFTGSPKVGKIVMEAAAKNLTSVTLELGGKSPCIIDDSVDIEAVAKKVLWGKLVNAGQTCIAPDYILIQENIKDVFIRQLQQSFHELFGTGVDLPSNKDYGRIINDKNYKRLQGYIENARVLNTEVIALGENEPEHRLMVPHIVVEPAPDSEVMQEEIFGPILPVLGYNEITNVPGFIRRLPRPLSLYIMSEKQKHIDYLLQHTTAGGTVINDLLIHYGNSNLPFGGVNHSGIGKGNGIYSFKAFSNERAVMHQKWGLTSVLQPPYTENKNKLVNFMLKWLS